MGVGHFFDLSHGGCGVRWWKAGDDGPIGPLIISSRYVLMPIAVTTGAVVDKGAGTEDATYDPDRLYPRG